MKNLIINLYENANFPIYLGAIIFVLLLAFFIVFFLGKKDKKNIEKTQRLEKVIDDAFNEVSSPVNVQVEAPSYNASNLSTQNKETNESQAVQEEAKQEPIVPLIPETPVEPIEERQVTNDVSGPIAMPIVSESSEPSTENPIQIDPIMMPKVENEVPSEEISMEEEQIKFPEVEPSIETKIENFASLADSIATEINELEKQEEKIKPLLNEETEPPLVSIDQANKPVIDLQLPDNQTTPEETESESKSEETNQPILTIVPESEEKDMTSVEPIIEISSLEGEKTTTVLNDVFSSVYAPKKDDVPLDETMAIELPKLKDSSALDEEKNKPL